VLLRRREVGSILQHGLRNAHRRGDLCAHARLQLRQSQRIDGRLNHFRLQPALQHHSFPGIAHAGNHAIPRALDALGFTARQRAIRVKQQRRNCAVLEEARGPLVDVLRNTRRFERHLQRCNARPQVVIRIERMPVHDLLWREAFGDRADLLLEALNTVLVVLGFHRQRVEPLQFFEHHPVSAFQPVECAPHG